MSMSHEHVSSLAFPFPMLYFTSHGYSVTTYLYFLISSPLHPFPHNPLPSGNHQNALCIHDSVYVLLVCIVCFLDSIANRYVFIAILFLFFIFFPFKKKDFVYLFLDRGREGQREGEKHQCVVVSHVPPTGDPARNPGSDRELDW